jgi:DNA-directed RNA polymerase specialized sigma24 family protein
MNDAIADADSDELNVTNILDNKQERELVWRRVFIGQSQREVATEMNVGKGTVSKVLREYRSINDGDLERRIISEFDGVVEPYK